jgi:hypothetical protein
VASPAPPRPDQHKSPSLADTHQQDPEQPSRSRALIGLVIIALLVVAAVYLVNALREESAREDCLMSGRSNCAPIEVPATGR